jgi:hypothetical protein
MAAALDWLANVHRADAGDDLPAQPGEVRSPRQMIAACEYELRQMRREIQAVRVEPTAPGTIPLAREPFVLGGRLRNDDFRASLAATTSPRAPGTASDIE